MKVSSRKLSRTLKKAGINNKPRGYTTTAIKDELQLAPKEYYTLKKSAKQLRITHLEKLASAMASKGNQKKESIIKQLRLREQQRSTAKKIKFLRGKLNKTSTTMITVKLPDGTSEDITDKHNMEKQIIANNKRKFQTSFSTPFYNYPYNKLFGYKGLIRASQEVLDGTFPAPIDASCHIKDFLKHSVMPKPIKDNPTSMDITLQSYVSFWKKARENTSCYPRKFAFATMKASSFDNSLATMDCVMTNIPMKTGYSPIRWQRCVDVMIQKKSNLTDVDSLRTICLFKVDANYCFKHIGREMMKNAEFHETLAQEQYGSRKLHQAIDLAVYKVLTNDILR